MTEWQWRAIIAAGSIVLSALGTWLISDHTRLGQSETQIAVEQARFSALVDQMNRVDASVSRLEHRLLGNGNTGLVTEVATLAVEVAHLSRTVAELRATIREIRLEREAGG